MLVLILGVGDATTTSTNKFQVTNIVADQHIKTNKQVVSTSGTTTTTTTTKQDYVVVWYQCGVCSTSARSKILVQFCLI